MNLSKNEIKCTLAYSKFEDSTKFDTIRDKKQDFENIKIETVLIKINSLSSKFQIRVFTLFCLFFFSMGIHAYTFLFMFLSPKIFILNQDNQGKIKANLKISR